MTIQQTLLNDMIGHIGYTHKQQNSGKSLHCGSEGKLIRQPVSFQKSSLLQVFAWKL